MSTTQPKGDHVVTSSDTTVEFEVDGTSSGPIPMHEFEDRATAAADRLRGTAQLSFDVGAPGNRPDFASVKIGGSIPIDRDLKRRGRVLVRIMSEDGELLCSRLGSVTAIGFKDKTDQYGTTTERIHTVSLD